MTAGRERVLITGGSGFIGARLARTLIEQVSRPYNIEGHKVTIGASLGIAIGDPGRASADALVRNADLALYAAKAAGRGKHRFYEATMHSEAAERQLLSQAYFYGWTAREIAEAEGIPLGTVKTRLRTALIKLRAANAEEARTGIRIGQEEVAP